jgi:hypothetical protein
MDELELLDLLAAAKPFNNTYTLTHSLNEGYFLVGVDGWPDSVPGPSPGAIRDLAERGWVRITGGNGSSPQFELSGAGRQLAEQRAAAASRPQRPAIALAWPGPKPTLENVMEAYEQQSAPEAGIKTPAIVEASEDQAAAAAHLRELLRTGFLESSYAGSGEYPVTVRPTEKSLRLLKGWPEGSANDVVENLLAMLDAEIANTHDEEKKSKLVQIRNGIGYVARDLFLKWAETKVGHIGP